MSNHRDHFIAAHFVLAIISLKRTLCHDHVVDLKFAGSSLHDLFFYGLLSDKSINYHVFRLAYSVRSVNSLQIDLWVPVRVKNDDNVCLMKVDSEAARSCGKNEDFLVTLRVLEVLDPVVTVKGRGLTVNSAVLVAAVSKEVVKDVEQPSHL